MKADKIVPVLEILFCAIIGGLFVYGGFACMVDPMYPQKGESYNFMIGLGGIVVGFFILRACYKMFMKEVKDK